MIGLLNVFATFDVGMKKEDVTEAVLLPEDWYLVELTKDVYQVKNKKWRDGGENLGADEIDGAGYTLVLQLRVVSDVPEESGRQFTKWLSLPNPSDDGAFMNDGQPKADWKADQVFNWYKAMGGEIEGSEVSVAPGAKVNVYVIQEIGMDGESLVNSISMNVQPKSVGGSGEEGDDVPF